MKRKTYRKIKVPRGYLSLHNDCWKLHSEIVRRNEKGICFTCLIKHEWQDCDCGHFKHACMDFNRKNTHCQCKKCNNWLKGNLDLYALRLEAKYGFGIIQELEKEKWTTMEPTYDELLILKEKLTKELKKLQNA